MEHSRLRTADLLEGMCYFDFSCATEARILLPIALDMILRKGMASSGWLAPKGGAGTPVVLVLPQTAWCHLQCVMKPLS